MPFHANNYPEFVCIVSAYSQFCYEQVARDFRTYMRKRIERRSSIASKSPVHGLTTRFNWRAFATAAGGDAVCATAAALAPDAARADEESTEIPTSKAAGKRGLVMTFPLI